MATPRARLRQRDSTALRGTATPGPSNSARTPGPSHSAHTPAPSGAITSRVPLPPYQPLAQPIITAGLDKLKYYEQEYNNTKLLEQLRATCEGLTEHAASLNEFLRDREESFQKRKAKRAKLQARQAEGSNGDEVTNGAEEDDQLEKEAEELRLLSEKVDKMTKRMEEKVMTLIDNEKSVENVQQAFKDVQRAANNDAGPGSTQVPNTQKTQTRTQTVSATASTSRASVALPNGSANDQEQEDGSDPSQKPPTSLVPHFEELVQTSNDDYQAQTRQARYANHNLFVGFKQATHFERHGENGPPLEPASRWFADSSGKVRLGDTAIGDEHDEDFSISHEKISTKCPITLGQFKVPVTSKKCHHSYEKHAIEDMLAAQRPPTAGSGRPHQGWVRSVPCPVTGCNHIVEKSDLEQNEMLIRRIKRVQKATERAAQRAREAAEDEEDDDEERGVTNDRAEEIESDSADELNEPRRLTQIKGERQKRKQTEDIDD